MIQAISLSLIFFSLSFACGREEYESPDENATLIAADETSTLTSLCGAMPVPKSGPLSYCKTMANGKITQVDLKPVTYVQDPETCEISSPDDGMLNTIIEMGFVEC